jgi:transglutaminase-like putative cysteine protease
MRDHRQRNPRDVSCLLTRNNVPLLLNVSHTTRYLYPVPATESYNEARLMPLSDNDQTCLEYTLTTTPPSRVHTYSLPTGMVHHFEIRTPHEALTIASNSVVETYRRDAFAGLQFIDDDFQFYASDETRQKYYEYLLPTPLVQLHPETDRIAIVARRQDGPSTASFLVALTRSLHRVLEYRPGVTTVDSTILHVLEQGSGVCQDFTHLMLAICRRQGIPARYVSGYLYNGVKRVVAADRPPDGPHTQDMARTEDRFADTAETSLIGTDAMHAWVECLMPDGSWKGFDPTNNLLTTANYIKVHYGRDYADVAPLRGVYRGPIAHTLEVSVVVYEKD